MENERPFVVRSVFVSRLLGYNNGISGYDEKLFSPYNDGEVDASYDPYEIRPYERDDCANDTAVNNLVSKVLVNSAVTLADGKDEYSDEHIPSNDDIPDVYKYRSASEYSDDSLPKRNFKNKRNKTRRSKESNMLDNSLLARECPPGGSLSMKDGKPMITMPLPLLRQYMLSEVTARVRNITHYYQEGHKVVNRDRLAILSRLIELQEENALLVERSSAAMEEMINYRLKYEELTTKQASAKRRRRKNKKARNCLTTSQSEITSSFDATEYVDEGNGTEDEVGNDGGAAAHKDCVVQEDAQTPTQETQQPCD